MFLLLWRVSLQRGGGQECATLFILLVYLLE